jgi:hypothetical protein
VAAKIFGTSPCFNLHTKNDGNPLPLRWDESASWQFALEMEKMGQQGWQLQG